MSGRGQGMTHTTHECLPRPHRLPRPRPPAADPQHPLSHAPRCRPRLLEAVPEPRSSSCGSSEAEEDAHRGDRPLLAVVPVPERPGSPLPGAAGLTPSPAPQHSVLLYSLQSHGYVRTLSFSSEVLGLQASQRLLVVALRGRLQAYDAATLQHTFSCLTYTPPAQLLLPASSGGRRGPPQKFVTDGLTSSGSSDGAQPLQQPGAAAAPPQRQAAAVSAPLAPFALGPRWLAYAADTPVPAAGGQAVAQRLPLRRDSSGARPSSNLEGDDSAPGAQQLGTSPGGSTFSNGLTTAAVADAALQVGCRRGCACGTGCPPLPRRRSRADSLLPPPLAAAAPSAAQAAAKGGQHLRAGLTAVGSASYKYLSHQYSSWRQGQQGGPQQQRDADVLEVGAGEVVVGRRQQCALLL